MTPATPPLASALPRQPGATVALDRASANHAPVPHDTAAESWIVSLCMEVRELTCALTR